VLAPDSPALLTRADAARNNSTNPVPSLGTPIDRNFFPGGSLIPVSFSPR
jgi:hypothetical protein